MATKKNKNRNFYSSKAVLQSIKISRAFPIIIFLLSLFSTQHGSPRFIQKGWHRRRGDSGKPNGPFFPQHSGFLLGRLKLKVWSQVFVAEFEFGFAFSGKRVLGLFFFEERTWVSQTN